MGFSLSSISFCSWMFHQPFGHILVPLVLNPFRSTYIWMDIPSAYPNFFIVTIFSWSLSRIPCLLAFNNMILYLFRPIFLLYPFTWIVMRKTVAPAIDQSFHQPSKAFLIWKYGQNADVMASLPPKEPKRWLVWLHCPPSPSRDRDGIGRRDMLGKSLFP